VCSSDLVVASARPPRVSPRVGDLAIVVAPIAVAALPVWVAAIIQ
jgi:hypothetical protein